MNRILLLAAATLLTFASCRKDYSCTCTRTITLASATTTDTNVLPITKSTHSEATQLCESLSHPAEPTASGATISANCQLN